MLIVTTNEIPGYRIEAVLGEVMGLTVRSANVGANLVASFRSLGGGEINEYSQLVYESRAQVMDRMWQQAVQRGGNAVVGMRFDTGDIAQSFSEVCAYGTAVVVHPIPEGELGSTPPICARCPHPPAGRSGSAGPSTAGPAVPGPTATGLLSVRTFPAAFCDGRGGVLAGLPRRIGGRLSRPGTNTTKATAPVSTRLTTSVPAPMASSPGSFDCDCVVTACIRTPTKGWRDARGLRRPPPTPANVPVGHPRSRRCNSLR